MMIKNYLDKIFELRYFEMNEFGVASPTTILTLLEETAADHCQSINHGLYDLGKRNIGWVLVSGIMQMERFPCYREKITIRTWMSKYTTIKGFRENIIYDEQNNIIGRAKGLWIFFDIARRRPAEIFKDIKEKWSFTSKESMDFNISQKIPALDNANYETKFKVRRYDTDLIKHVNNIKYLQWMVESMPEKIVNNYYLHSVDCRFIAEACLGQTIVSLTKTASNNIKDPSFLHTFRIEGTDKVCTTAKSVWKKLKI